MLRLVKKINLVKPGSPIFARRETLAREAGKSVETVGRALRWLENAGLIQREQEEARPGLRGSEAHIYPTDRLIQALGIGERRDHTSSQTALYLQFLENSLFRDSPPGDLWQSQSYQHHKRLHRSYGQTARQGDPQGSGMDGHRWWLKPPGYFD